MIVNQKIFEDDTGKIIECIIDSSNVLKTQYFPHRKKLYVFFKKGKVYSYTNVEEDIYNEFENSNSQGEFLHKIFMKNPSKYPYAKEFTMIQSEINEIKEIIKEWKNQN